MAVADGGVYHASRYAAIAFSVGGGIKRDVAVDADVLHGGIVSKAEEASVVALLRDAQMLHLEVLAVEGAAKLVAFVADGCPVADAGQVNVACQNSLGSQILLCAVSQRAVYQSCKPAELSSIAYFILAACVLCCRLI